MLRPRLARLVRGRSAPSLFIGFWKSHALRVSNDDVVVQGATQLKLGNSSTLQLFACFTQPGGRCQEKTGGVLPCERGMACAKGGGATGGCLTVPQSLGPRERHGVELKMAFQQASRSSMR